MQRLRSITLLIVAGAMLVPATSDAATSEFDPTPALDVSVSPGEWILIEFEVAPGVTTGFSESAVWFWRELSGTVDTTSLYSTAWFGPDGEEPGVWASSFRSGRGVTLSLPQAGQVIGSEPSGGIAFNWKSGFSPLELPPGRYLWLASHVVKGNETLARFRITGDGVTVDDISRGEGSFAYEESSFDRSLHAHASGADAVALASKSVEVSDPLFGFIAYGGTVGSAGLTYEGPASARSTGFGTGYPAISVAKEPAGTHLFGVELGVGAPGGGWHLAGVAPDVEAWNY